MAIVGMCPRCRSNLLNSVASCRHCGLKDAESAEIQLMLKESADLAKEAMKKAEDSLLFIGVISNMAMEG